MSTIEIIRCWCTYYSSIGAIRCGPYLNTSTAGWVISILLQKHQHLYLCVLLGPNQLFFYHLGGPHSIFGLKIKLNRALEHISLHLLFLCCFIKLNQTQSYTSLWFWFCFLFFSAIKNKEITLCLLFVILREIYLMHLYGIGSKYQQNTNR